MGRRASGSWAASVPPCSEKTAEPQRNASPGSGGEGMSCGRIRQEERKAEKVESGEWRVGRDEKQSAFARHSPRTARPLSPLDPDPHLADNLPPFCTWAGKEDH